MTTHRSNGKPGTRRTQRCAAVAVTIGWLGAQVPTGAEPAAEVPTSTAVPAAPAFTAVRAAMLARVRGGELPSIAVGAARGSEVLWLEVLGWADRPAGRPATTATSYAIGSTSKSLTATATFALLAAGRLRAEAPAAPLLGRILRTTDGSPVSDELTVRHLLDSTGGIPHGSRSCPLDESILRPLPPDEAAFVAFAPGSHFEYSNHSFGALQQIIEQVTSKDYDAALRELVFEPLQMRHSGADRAGIGDFAELDGTARAPRRLVPAGGLGLYTSVGDLLRFGMFHAGALATGPFDAEWRRRMHADDSGAPFHSGWWHPGGGTTLVSNGNVAGANAHVSVLPAEQVTVVVLTNRSTNAADELAGQVVDALVPGNAERSRGGREAYMRRYRTPYHASPAFDGSWSGTARVGMESIRFAIAFADDAVSVRWADEPVTPLDHASLNELGEVRGRFRGSVLSLAEQPLDFRLLLVREDDRLTGYLGATVPGPGGGDIPFAVTALRASAR